MAVRAIVAKMGLDGHNRGANFISNEFRDAGVEVVYLGRFNDGNDLAVSAIQEDVDVIAISFLSNEYRMYVPDLYESLQEYESADDFLVLLGGIIDEADHDEMLKYVDYIFGQDTTTDKVLSTIEREVGPIKTT